MLLHFLMGFVLGSLLQGLRDTCATPTKNTETSTLTDDTIDKMLQKLKEE